MEKKVIEHKKKVIINIKFDSEPVYGDNDKYIKTKTKIYDGNVNTNFQGKRVPKENVSYRCLPLIMLDYIVKVKKKYYPQALLEGCRYELKKTKMENLINDVFEPRSSDDESDKGSDNEINNEKDNEPGNETDNESDNDSFVES